MILESMKTLALHNKTTKNDLELMKTLAPHNETTKNSL